MPQHSSAVTRALCAATTLVALMFVFASAASAVTINADAPSLGPVPDGTVGGNICGDFGAARDVTFTVAGLPAGAPADVGLGFSMETVSPTGGPGHPWAGDLEVVLIAPGGATTKTIVKQTGSTTATGCGDDSNVLGPYTFSDSAPAAPTWFGAATTANSTTAIPTGSYRAATPGGVVGGGVNTLITPEFAGLSSPNGTWTLRFRDGGESDVGKVSAANLTLTAAPQVALTVTKLGTGQGTVTGTGIDCGLICAASYGKNATVALTATPAAGSTFAGWSGCDAATGNECNLGMSSDRTASATFDAVGIAPPTTSPSPSPNPNTNTQARKKKCGKGKKLKGGKCVKKHHKHHKKTRS